MAFAGKRKVCKVFPCSILAKLLLPGELDEKDMDEELGRILLTVNLITVKSCLAFRWCALVLKASF